MRKAPTPASARTPSSAPVASGRRRGPGSRYQTASPPAATGKRTVQFNGSGDAVNRAPQNSSPQRTQRAQKRQKTELVISGLEPRDDALEFWFFSAFSSVFSVASVVNPLTSAARWPARSGRP